MIWDSSFWKDDLLRIVRDLRRRQKQQQWREASNARVEKGVMVGLYSVRKLIEAHLISDATARVPVPLHVFPSTGRRVTHTNWHNIDRLYDLSMPGRKTIPLVGICSMLIHSYIFMVETESAGGLSGILFNTRETRLKALYRIQIETLIDLLERVAADYPNEVHMHFNERRGDYDIESITR